MANEYFNASGAPATRSPGSSAVIRALFESIATAFDKMPVMTANGGKVVRINAGGTGLESVAAATLLAGAALTASSLKMTADGTVGAPAIAFDAEPTLGFYRSAAGTLTVAIGGQPRMSWAATEMTIAGAISQTGGNFSLNGPGTPDVDATRLFSTSNNLYLQCGDGDHIFFRDTGGGQVAALDTAGGLFQISGGADPKINITKAAGGSCFEASNTADADFIVEITAAGAGTKYASLRTFAPNAVLMLGATNQNFWTIDGAGSFYPIVHGTYQMGGVGNRMSNVYSVLGNFSGAVTVSGVLTASAGLGGVLTPGAGLSGSAYNGSTSRVWSIASTSNGYGSRTVSTAAASGVPSDGDIWYQREV